MPDIPYLLAADGTPDAQPQPLDGGAGAPAMPAPAAPNVSAAPAPQPAPPSPAVPLSPAAADVAHHAALGKVAQFLLGNNTSYQIDPSTGKMVQTTTPRAPGQLFSSILAGALLGAVTGSQNKSGNGLQAAGQGAAAVLNQQNQQNAQNRQQAQTDFENKRQLDQDAQRKQMQAATIAHMVNGDLIANANLDFVAQNRLKELQANYDARTKALTDAGAQRMPVLIDGKDVNGIESNWPAIQKGVIDGQIKAPAGYHIVPSQSINTDGLTFEPGKGYVDKDGKPVDLSSRTTHTLYAVPDDLGTKVSYVPGSDLIALNPAMKGTVDPKHSYPLTGNEVMALSTKGLDFTTKAAERDNKEAETAKAQMDTKLAPGKAASENAEHYAQATKARAEASKAVRETEQLGQEGGSDDDYLRGMLSPIPTVDIYSDTTVRNNRREQLVRAAQKLDPNFNEVNYKQKIGLVKDFTQGKDAQSIQSFDTFLGHVGDLSEAVQHLRNTSIPLVNTPLNKLRKQSGNPAVSSILIPIDAARTEFQNFLNNNHALTETDKAEGQKLLNEDMSPAQFEGQTKQFTRTALIRMGAMNDKFHAATGENWPNMLSENGRSVLRGFGMGPDTSHYLGEKLPPQAASQVKEGQLTKFNNGQVWTSTNGQPWRVQ